VCNREAPSIWNLNKQTLVQPEQGRDFHALVLSRKNNPKEDSSDWEDNCRAEATATLVLVTTLPSYTSSFAWGPVKPELPPNPPNTAEFPS